MPVMNLLLFGPPGVGKGTQGERFSSATGISHLAMGDILRAAVRDETGAGKQARVYMDAGKLVPDALVVSMIEDHLVEGANAGFLLDGFPRNVAQAKALEIMLAHHDLTLDKIVFMDAPESHLIKRLSGRLICRACGFGFHRHYSPPRETGRCDRCGGELYQREDDREDVIVHRLRVYNEQTEPLLAYYRDKAGFVRLDASGEMQAVYTALKEAVEG